jgi:hypothetical protein
MTGSQRTVISLSPYREYARVAEIDRRATAWNRGHRAERVVGLSFHREQDAISSTAFPARRSDAARE